MRKKVLYILLIFVIISFTAIIVTLMINKKSKNSDNIKSDTIEKDEIRISDLNISGEELINILTRKNGDWSNLPLTNNFRKKFNEQDGILGTLNYDSVEKNPYYNNKYPFENYSYIVVKNGKQETAYMYSFILDIEGEHYEDFRIDRVFYLTDENGNELDAKSIINIDNYVESFYMLSAGYEDEQCIGVTSKFHTKYPYFLDIFEHYSPLEYNHIKFVEEKSSWERKEAYFEVDSALECKKRYYLVEFALDEKGYLDDVVVHKVNEVEYEGNRQERINKITYQNSNWDNLNLTGNFRKKFFSESGIVEDIENINIDIPVDEVSLEMNTKYITCFTSKSGEIIAYYFEYIKDNEDSIDNIICNKLPYINKSAEEAKELYLKEYN